MTTSRSIFQETGGRGGEKGFTLLMEGQILVKQKKFEQAIAKCNDAYIAAERAEKLPAPTDEL